MTQVTEDDEPIWLARGGTEKKMGTRRCPSSYEQSLYHRRGIVLIGVANIVRVEVRLAILAAPVEVHGVTPRSIAGTNALFAV